MFKGIAPPRQFPATVASGAPPRPNHACCEERVDVSFETLCRRGGEGFAMRTIRCFFLKKSALRALRAHNVSTYYARTPVGHRVHQHAACLSWGSPPWGLKTWLIAVVEVRKVMEGALRALVHRTIKVVLVVTRRIGCIPRSLLFGLEKCVKALLVSCPLPGGLQWACPTIPLFSGLRFTGRQGWSMRSCWWLRGSCSGGGGGRRRQGRG